MNGKNNLKKTDIPWYGEVPSHWQEKRLRDCIESCVAGAWGEDPVGDENDIPVIRVADFNREQKIVNTFDTLRNIEPKQRVSRELKRGDLLIEKSGGGEQTPVGSVVLYDGEPGAISSNFVARLRLKSGLSPKYFVYLHSYLWDSRVTHISIKQTTGIQNLDTTAYLSEKCIVPPVGEQELITKYLDEETARIDELIAQKNSEIDLLKELRNATIADAVLGKDFGKGPK